MKKFKCIFVLSSFLCFADILPAYANAGVPMLSFYLPPAWFTLVPIILIETFVAVRKYSLPLKTSFSSVSIANLTSTLIGIPLTWFIWATFEMIFWGGVLGEGPISWGLLSVTLQAAWLLPYEEHLWWMGPAACLVLSLVFYLVSVFFEYQVVKLFFKKQQRNIIRAFILRSNFYSYCILFFLACLLIIFYKELSIIIRTFDPIVYWLSDIVARISELMY